MLDWYTTLAGLINTRSFSSLWYWVTLGLFWAGAGRRVLGVPLDVLTRAHAAQDEGAEAEFDTLMHHHAARILRIARRSGPWLLALAACVVTMLAILGFGHGIEIAQAVLMILAPLILIRILEALTARRIETGGATGAALRSIAFWHRFRIQLLGLVCIFVTAMWGMWRNLTLSALGH